MFVTHIVAPFLGVNCYIAAATVPPLPTGTPQRCLLIDAGLDCVEPLAEKLAGLGLEPAAVLLTHGHPDHVLGLPDVLHRWPVPAYLGVRDNWWLDDPVGSLGPEFAAVMRQALADRRWSAPTVLPPDAGPMRLAGLTVTPIAAPGHTEGSTLWQISADSDEDVHVFTGDVLFASGVGRTDLAGGDQGVMEQTLATVIPALPRGAAVHPGHGPSSTVDRELAANPFLAG